MRTTGRLIVTLALVAGVMGAPAASGTFGGCDDGQDDRLLWCHGGDHWRPSQLPLRLKLGVDSIPAGSGISTADLTSAATLAALEWDRHWPGTGASSCGTLARLVCIDGTTRGKGVGKDGVNTISFGDPARCGGTPATAIAVACLWYEHERGPSGKRIAEVDIVLNANLAAVAPGAHWRQPPASADGIVGGAIDEVTGEVRGAALPDGCSLPLAYSPCWVDLQSVLVHEIGHALGLDHVGHATRRYPATIASGGEAAKYQLTMYRWYYFGTTNKRTLDAGDVLGLQEVAADTYRDV